MKKHTFLLFISLFFVACAPKATPEEVQLACENQLQLGEKAKASTPKDPIQDIEKRYEKELKQLQSAQMLAIQAIDAQYQEKRASVKDEAAKEAIKAVYDAQKNEKVQEMAPAFQALQKKRVEAIQKAQQAQEAAEQQRQAQRQKDLQTCIENATQNRLSKDKAQCLIKAKTPEEIEELCLGGKPQIEVSN